MAWFKVDDGFHSHPKAIAAGNAACGLWSRCGSWSSDHGTDGFITTAVARAYGTRTEIKRLVDVALWFEVDGGYLMHDFHDYNPTADEVAADRAEKHEAKVRAGHLGGIASGVARRKHSRSKPEAEHEANGSAEREQNEAPSRPDPSHLFKSAETNISSEVPDPPVQLIDEWAERRRA